MLADLFAFYFLLLTPSIIPEEATSNVKPAKDDSENDVRTEARKGVDFGVIKAKFIWCFGKSNCFNYRVTSRASHCVPRPLASTTCATRSTSPSRLCLFIM